MEHIKQILALSRLLEYSSNLKNGISNSKITFDDEIGEISKFINNRLTKSKKLNIFNPTIKYDDILKFEHFISNSISNYTSRKLIKRDINDEVQILLNSTNKSVQELDNYNVSISNSLKEDFKKLKHLTEKDILDSLKNALYLSVLPDNDELGNQYFTTSKIMLNKTEFIIVAELSHETRKKDNLELSSFFIFSINDYLKYIKNPTQMFLKGLDKYGLDMKIKNNVSRYYYEVSIPLNTNIGSLNFLNLQNIDPKQDFSLRMSLKQTELALELRNVYAINLTLLYNDIDSYFAQQCA
jgi:hypothetical protein